MRKRIQSEIDGSERHMEILVNRIPNEHRAVTGAILEIYRRQQDKLAANHAEQQAQLHKRHMEEIRELHDRMVEALLIYKRP